MNTSEGTKELTIKNRKVRKSYKFGNVQQSISLMLGRSDLMILFFLGKKAFGSLIEEKNKNV